ncbi:tRNA endonuclease ANKZF1-like [Halyomorpha halys]|uniref:tRNA endonuclease ANKZF1-like n=1 Tax=Halyomorpha halys TaxID=286706 RepID=UPI0006D4CE56
MLHGADPNIRDKKTQTPYDHAPDKTMRNTFRRFRGEFPEMYDYSKSHIPDALTEELEAEIAEKKRQAKKAKRQKDKERRIAAETNKREDDEKKRFLKLSDREKVGNIVTIGYMHMSQILIKQLLYDRFAFKTTISKF